MHLNTILLLIPAILFSGVTSAPAAHKNGHQHGAAAITGAGPIARDGGAKSATTDRTWWYGYAQKRGGVEQKPAKRGETDKAWWYVYEGKRDAGAEE
jgi:hypothetical protein